MVTPTHHHHNFLSTHPRHWGLGKLISFYDDNHISIDGDTEIAFTESVDKRFEALGWHVIWVKNGNTGFDEIRAAIKEAKAVTDRPTLIKFTTTIGYGSPNKSNSYSVHGSELGAKEVDATRNNLGWPYEPFHVPEDVKKHWSRYIPEGAAVESKWNAKFADLALLLIDGSYGHWGLGKLIAFYDDNHISIDGDTEIAFTESVDKRFEALGWHVIWVKNGNTDFDEIRAAIKEAKVVTDRPTLIKFTTTIGYGSPNKSNSYSVHGSALGAKEVDATRNNLGWPYEPFHVPEDVKKHWSRYIPEGTAVESKWNAKFADLALLLIDGSYGFEMETFEFLNIMQVHGFPK
ncbi:hypothetical protein RYX36_010182, partial [Vicia faba]